jgi:carboxyl-terminal processing protease
MSYSNMSNTPFSNRNNNNQSQDSSLRTKISLWLPLLVSVAIAGGIWIGFELHKRTRTPYIIQSDGTVSSYVQSGKVEEVLRFVDARYIEKSDIEKLENAAIEGLLQQLDPHSAYISLSDIGGVTESLSGGFEGIGVEFFIVEDTVYIVGVIPDGPSDKAGVKTGDKIITVGDSSAVGTDKKRIIDQLKGPSGSEIEVGLVRASDQQYEKITIKRGEIPIRSIDIAYMLDEKTAFIKINRFSDKTYKEFMQAIEQLIEKDGMSDLIIDLRQNPGGYLTAATDMLNQLFDSKKMLVYTEGRSYKRQEYFSNGKTFFRVGKIAVLIDEGSASASEIMAGAIQDNDRGIIVGRRSFGKGLVQEQFPLSDGSAMRLTVAKYYTPSGRLIQKPYQKGEEEAYNQDLKQRYESGELYHRDSVKIADTTKYFTQAGRIVYGGGGIMPDIFVPLDTIQRNRYYNQLLSQTPIFVYKFMNTARAELSQYKTYEEFNQKYVLTDKVFDSFIAYTETKNIRKDEKLLPLVRNKVMLYIRAYIAQQLFRDNGYFRTLHQQDEMLKRASQALRQNTTASSK